MAGDSAACSASCPAGDRLGLAQPLGGEVVEVLGGEAADLLGGAVPSALGARERPFERRVHVLEARDPPLRHDGTDLEPLVGRACGLAQAPLLFGVRLALLRGHLLEVGG